MRDHPQRPLGHRLYAVDRLHRQDGFLEVGREQEQSEQLGDARSREPELAGQVTDIEAVPLRAPREPPAGGYECGAKIPAATEGRPSESLEGPNVEALAVSG